MTIPENAAYIVGALVSRFHGTDPGLQLSACLSALTDIRIKHSLHGVSDNRATYGVLVEIAALAILAAEGGSENLGYAYNDSFYREFPIREWPHAPFADTAAKVTDTYTLPDLSGVDYKVEAASIVKEATKLARANPAEIDLLRAQVADFQARRLADATTHVQAAMLEAQAALTELAASKADVASLATKTEVSARLPQHLSWLQLEPEGQAEIERLKAEVARLEREAVQTEADLTRIADDYQDLGKVWHEDMTECEGKLSDALKRVDTVAANEVLLRLELVEQRQHLAVLAIRIKLGAALAKLKGNWRTDERDVAEAQFAVDEFETKYTTQIALALNYVDSRSVK